MVNVFRRFQQPLLVALTILVIVAFVWLYNPSQRANGMRTDRVAVIFGRSISQSEFERTYRHFEVCQALMMFDLLGELVGRATSMSQAQENFTYNVLILRHEAEELGIMSARPTDAERKAYENEIEDSIKKIPMFQTAGSFDSARYNMFVQNALAPRGFTGRELEDAVADQIRLRRVQDLLGATVGVLPSELRETFTQQHQKSEAAVIRLKLDDFKAAAQFSEDDLKKAYEERKAMLSTPEKRKVKYVSFAVDPKTPLAPGPEKAAKMEALMNQAQEFAQTMTGKEAQFDTAAAAAKAKPAETPAFSRDQPPAELGRSPQVAQAAFQLSKEQPNSDVIGSSNGYYVLQLAGIEESCPLTFEEAKPRLTEQLKQERGQEAMNLKAAEWRAKITTDLKAGKPFAEAAKAAGATPEKLPPFSSTEPPKDAPDGQQIVSATSEQAENSISEFLPTPTGGDLIYLEKRLPIADADFEKAKAGLAEQAGEMRRRAIFADWLNARHKAANIQVGRG